MNKLGWETRFLLFGTTIIFTFSILLSLAIALWLSKEFQSNMILHDYETAGYLLRDNDSTRTAAAFTKEKSSEDFERGRQLLEAASYSEQTAINLLPIVEEYKNRTMLTLFIFTFTISLMVYGILYIYLCRQKHTLQSAEMAVRDFLDGNTAARIKSNRDGDWDSFFHEVNGLTTILNAHAETERRTKEFLQDTISDISHQLKTPLTALKMYNEIIHEDRSQEAVVMEFCGKSAKEIERIKVFIYTLLKLAKLDAGTISLDRKQENIEALLQDVAERFATRAKQEHKIIDLAGDASATLYCDALWLSEAIGNIVKNALEHTEANARVTIKWQYTPLMTSIVIEDNGKGIHPADIHNVFKRFYRSRFSQDTQGIGLGLPLAKAIIEAHGGTILVKSSPGRGSVFSLNFFNLTKM